MMRMKNTILFLLGSMSFLFSSTTVQAQCNLEANSIVCPFEKIFISYNSDAPFNSVKVSAFNQTGTINIPALIQNKTDASAEIIFLEQGNAEIVIQFYQNATVVDVCNQNVMVFGGEPITALGMVSDYLGDQVACEAIDIDFDILLNCPDCSQAWTINGQSVDLPQEGFTSGNFQSITTTLAIDSLGEYTLCQVVLKADSACFVEDCVILSIIEIVDSPKFEIVDEEDITYCLGSEIGFKNTTEVLENVTYHWTVSYDTLVWNYYGEDFSFSFDFPGEYLVSQEYTLTSNTSCTSPVTSTVITISDSPSLSISCNGQLCFENKITYRAPINCANYNWVFDPNLGTLVNLEDSIITIKWNEVPVYTETELLLFVNDCETDVCQQLSRKITLFPSEITIDGALDLCDNGAFIYSTDYIPGADYLWEIEIIDSLSGVLPKIIFLQDYNVTVEIFSFVGEFNLKATAFIENRGCEVSTSQKIRRFNFIYNDKLCREDLFKVEFLPKTDEDILWTITNEEGTYFKEELKSGLSSFLAFGFPSGGIYTVTAAIPSLDFTCESALAFEVIESPEIILTGPLSVCVGEAYSYSLLDLGANDLVIWEVFQNGMFTEITAQEITVTWLEGGAPYLIRVKRSTESSPGQICESDDFLYSINVIDPNSLSITGEETVCYDAVSTYKMSIPGAYDWSIEPPYMGTIIDGENSDSITIQWHYAPGVGSATLSYITEICGQEMAAELVVIFAPFQPIINLPDKICQSTRLKIEVENLSNYDIIEYFINGELVADDRPWYFYTFNEAGWVDVQIKILNPNDCPGLSDTTITIYVDPAPLFEFEYTGSLVQCPQDSFETISASPDLQDGQHYYTWILDGDTLKQGFGNIKLYSCLVTREMILNDTTLNLIITSPNGCVISKGIPLNFTCDPPPIKCECKEEVVASIDYIIRHECNLISFGGSLDFSTMLYAEWRIAQGDTITSIPINGEADLTQDSLYLTDDLTVGDVALRVLCDGQIRLDDGTFQDTICDFIQDGENFPLFYPQVDRTYVCNDNLNFDITLTNRRYPTSPPEDEYTLAWTINGLAYSGEVVEVLDIQAEEDIAISLTQCTLDGLYCCTRDTIIKSPPPFDPQIILPNGTCENELWEFTIDLDPMSVQSILWDFGDGSGSTLVTTEKGYDNTDAQSISVIVTNDLGCTASDTIMIESFENLIDGEIDFTNAPCDSEAPLTYIENNKSVIVSYEWSVFEAGDTSTIIVTESGNYVVTVTDNHGCTSISVLNNASINESFSRGIFVKEENCGIANAFISANDQFIYTWYLNGDSTSMGGSIAITEPGQYNVLVVSTLISTNTICDSISKTIIVHPQPELPNVTSVITFCDPLIAELTVTNYPEVNWTGIGINEVSNTFNTSTPGLYYARYTDENSCASSRTVNIIDNKVNFDYLTDICFQACREDLDSLQFVIPGNEQSFIEWSWSSIDSTGLEYTVAASSGTIPELIVNDEMYDYLELKVVASDCEYSSGQIPLDIIQCIIIVEDEDVLCDTIDIFSSDCGFTVYECVVSEQNGGPKYYYEGHISTNSPAFLCRDSLIASMSNGHIDILNFETIVNSDGTLYIDYSANIFIDNIHEFEENGAYIRFDFCDEMGIEIYCIEYLLPYRSCNVDFDCLIDCVGIFYGTEAYVYVNYCLNLTDVVQDDCTLESYYMTLAMTNDSDSKLIYEEVITGDFNQLYCLDIPISIEDFTSGEFECLEMYVEGDCSDILCYDYQCGAFSPGFESNGSNTSSRTSSTRLPFKIVSPSAPEIQIYPNPSNGKMTISYTDFEYNDRYLIKNTLGQIVQNGDIETAHSRIDLSDKNEGLYFISIERDGEILVSRKVLLVD
ncbi:MAG: hypothetical protein ACI9P5_001925 [Saprospiraceae bacterium]|jgi:hypothetical protein